MVNPTYHNNVAIDTLLSHVGADAHIGPHLRATGQLRAGVGTRPYVQAPQDSPPKTEPRK